MSTTTEYTGKDIEEAISNACKDLDVTREQLEIKVISPGSAGIFGLLRKKAIIQAEKKAPAELAKYKIPRKKTDTSPKKPRVKKDKKYSSKSPKISYKSATPEVLAEIKKATETILKLMGYPATASMTESNGKVLVQLSGDNMETIIGEEGNTLDALQYLVRKIVSQKFSEKIMLSMDAGDFRATRKKELEELALEIARIVKEGGKARIIAPLNPAERRIIHVALQTDNTIRSKSIGEGLYKKIKVYIPGQAKRRSGKKSHYNKKRSSKKRSS